MCETLYILFHSELKKDACIDEMTIENRMVEIYHAHTDENTKLRIMSKLSSENITIRVLIATVACGMGVNIPDISIVILWGLPPSLLHMWQEIGRCGRDGDLVLPSVIDMQKVFQCHVNSVAKKGNTTANAMTVNT